MSYNIAIAFIIFNRPDTTKEVFEKIAEVKPRRLYLISDAPREGNEDDKVKVRECRAYVESRIDWPCHLTKIYADKNMGCRDRVYTGITEVFEHEEKAVIIEDDVVPGPGFFEFMEEMLNMYEHEPKVMMVSGTNLLRNYRMQEPYCFSCFPSIWGWGSWARAWKYYDVDVSDWPQRKEDGSLKGIYGPLTYNYLKLDIERVYTKEKDTWDIQWDYCRHVHRGLGIVPRANMVRNIGFDREDATHTKSSTKEDFSYGEMKLPLNLRLPVRRSREYDRAYLNKYFGLSKITGFIKKKLGK